MFLQFIFSVQCTFSYIYCFFFYSHFARSFAAHFHIISVHTIYVIGVVSIFVSFPLCLSISRPVLLRLLFYNRFGAIGVQYFFLY